MTFMKHLSNWFWAYQQYSHLKATLQDDEAIMVEDFAENRKASYSAEVS